MAQFHQEVLLRETLKSCEGHGQDGFILLGKPVYKWNAAILDKITWDIFDHVRNFQHVFPAHHKMLRKRSPRYHFIHLQK